MVRIEDIPRDANGILQGAWRILHRDPSFHGGVGAMELRSGQSHEPIAGRRLVGIIAVFGGDLFLEPWGPLPRDFTLPPMVDATVPEEALAKLERCPWRDPPASTETGEPPDPEKTAPVDDGLDALAIEQLRELVEALGQKPGNKQEKALIKMIRAERAKASETPAADASTDPPASTETGEG